MVNRLAITQMIIRQAQTHSGILSYINCRRLTLCLTGACSQSSNKQKRDWETNLSSRVGVDGFDRRSRSGNTFEIKLIFIYATSI